MKSPFRLVDCALATLTLLSSAFVFADEPIIAPGDNLVIENIPAIPAGLAAEVGRYTEFRAAGLQEWHPTEREVLISTRFGNTSQLHHVAMPGGARKQVTFFEEPVGGATFEPNEGNYLVISKDIGGNEYYQLFRFDLASGEATLLTDGKSRYARGPWSRSGEWLAYERVDSNEQGAFTEFYVINPADPSTNRLVATLEGGGWGVTDWSPDDKTWALEEYLSVNESNVYLMDVATGEKKLLTKKDEGEKSAYRGAEFSSDGRYVYLATDAGSEFLQLTRIDLKSGERQVLTESIPWDVQGFTLSDDGSMIAFVTNEDGVSRLRVMRTRNHREIDLPKLPLGTIGGLEWHANNRDLGFSLSSARSTSDVYSMDVKKGKIERWTESETGGLDASQFAEPELIRWKTFDDRTISGFLYRPPAKFSGPRPVVINIHGGPEGQSRPGFMGPSNYFLNELGVALIYPNVRGSVGYGKTFSQLDNGILREDSYKDIEALLDWIATDKGLDADRIMVTGGSYGGHMTLAVSTYYSDRIRCAVDVVGISNLRTFLENTSGYRRDLRRVEYGDERDPKMREFLDRIAPQNNLDKIRKPLFVIQGANDPRVPKSESDQIVAALKRTGTPVWYLVANDEGHGFSKKNNRDFQFYATVMFMKQYLLN